jgi:DNA-binding LytR/AlgR family response regulator
MPRSQVANDFGHPVRVGFADRVGPQLEMSLVSSPVDMMKQETRHSPGQGKVTVSLNPPVRRVLPGSEASPGNAIDTVHFISGEREHRIHVLRPSMIDCIESFGNYVRLCVGADRYLRRDSLKCLEVTLAPCGFIRIKSSLLVNLNMVRYIEKAGSGTFSLALVDGRKLRSSATYRSNIARALHLGRPVNPEHPSQNEE